MVIYGCDGLDEATLTTKTKVVEIRDGELKSYYITPEEFGLERCSKEALQGGNPEENAEITRNILNGTETGAKRDVVILNSALAFYTAGKGTSIKDCVSMARTVINNGMAQNKLEQFIRLSNEALAMSDILSTIAARALERVEERKKQKPLDALIKGSREPL